MLIWEPVHERPSREAAFVRHARAALSVGLACSRTTQYAPRARPPSALHLAIPEQAPPPQYPDTLLAPFTRAHGPPNLLREPLKIPSSSFRRRPESSIFNRLDTGLRRCDEFLEVPLIHRLSHLVFVLGLTATVLS